MAKLYLENQNLYDLKFLFYYYFIVQQTLIDKHI